MNSQTLFGGQRGGEEGRGMMVGDGGEEKRCTSQEEAESCEPTKVKRDVDPRGACLLRTCSAATVPVRRYAVGVRMPCAGERDLYKIEKTLEKKRKKKLQKSKEEQRLLPYISEAIHSKGRKQRQCQRTWTARERWTVG